jgi:hypothetical protein
VPNNRAPAGLDYVPVDLLACLIGEVHGFIENAFTWKRDSLSREEKLRKYHTSENCDGSFHVLSILFTN